MKSKKITYFDLLKMSDQELLSLGYRRNNRGGLTKINAKLPNAIQDYPVQSNSISSSREIHPEPEIRIKRGCCGKAK